MVTGGRDAAVSAGKDGRQGQMGIRDGRRRGCRCCGSKGCAGRSVSGSLGKDASCRLEARCEDRCDNQICLGSEPGTAYDVAVLALGVNDVAQLLSVSRWRAPITVMQPTARALQGTQDLCNCIALAATFPSASIAVAVDSRGAGCPHERRFAGRYCKRCRHAFGYDRSTLHPRCDGV